MDFVMGRICYSSQKEEVDLIHPKSKLMLTIFVFSLNERAFFNVRQEENKKG